MCMCVCVSVLVCLCVAHECVQGIHGEGEQLAALKRPCPVDGGRGGQQGGEGERGTAALESPT